MRPPCAAARTWARNYRTAGTLVAVAHEFFFDAGRRIKRAAVSRLRAISEPSTRYTRGPPPGALRAGTITCPGRKPSSISRRATSSGRSRRSRIPDSPRGNWARVVGARAAFRASFGALLTLSCIVCLLFAGLLGTSSSHDVRGNHCSSDSITDLFSRSYRFCE